jgi:hypothetical protein
MIILISLRIYPVKNEFTGHVSPWPHLAATSSSVTEIADLASNIARSGDGHDGAPADSFFSATPVFSATSESKAAVRAAPAWRMTLGPTPIRCACFDILFNTEIAENAKVAEKGLIRAISLART